MKNKNKKKNKVAHARRTPPAAVVTRTSAPQIEAGTRSAPALADAAGDRLYTAEELGAKYGVSVDEVMAIANALGIVGDPRYGRWVPAETPPHESSEERIPISTSTGPIVRANVDHMLRQIDDQMPELLTKSIEAGADFTILVYDPTKPITGKIQSSKERELIAHAKGKPLAALLPTETVLSLLNHFERTPDLLTALERLKAPRDGTRVPIVLMYGHVFGFYEAIPSRDYFAMSPDIDATQLPGSDGYVLSLAGAIKTICSADPEDTTPGWPTERCRLARARAIVAIEAEGLKPKPRSINEVLVDTFGGDRLRGAFETKGAVGLVEVIDSVLRATN